MDDLQAIRRLKNGDIGGLESLIAGHQARAVKTAYLVTRQENLAEEVVQESFVRFYERVRYFDETRPFEAYFLRSVVNCALNSLEREHTSLSFDDERNLPALQSLLEHAAPVEAQVEYAQQKAEVARLLESLSPRQRAVVVLRYYLELSEKEMSTALDVAPGTVKWLLNAARRRLRALLGPERMAK